MDAVHDPMWGHRQRGHIFNLDTRNERTLSQHMGDYRERRPLFNVGTSAAGIYIQTGQIRTDPLAGGSLHPQTSKSNLQISNFFFAPESRRNQPPQDVNPTWEIAPRTTLGAINRR